MFFNYKLFVLDIKIFWIGESSFGSSSKSYLKIKIVL